MLLTQAGMHAAARAAGRGPGVSELAAPAIDTVTVTAAAAAARVHRHGDASGLGFRVHVGSPCQTSEKDISILALSFP